MTTTQSASVAAASRVAAGDIAAAGEWFVQAIDYPSRGKAVMAPPPAIARWLPDAEVLVAKRDRVAYCGLFDIGKPEPPVPLLESHYHRDGHTRLRRVVNFYRAYGVAQDAHHAPDHLCVELAYLAYLGRVASLYPLRADLVDAARAFARVHPGSFVAKCAQALRQHDSTGVYAALFSGLDRFLVDVGGETAIPVTSVGASSVGPASAGQQRPASAGQQRPAEAGPTGQATRSKP